MLTDSIYKMSVYFKEIINNVWELLIASLDPKAPTGFEHSFKSEAEKVFDYVMSKKAVMLRIALRYTIEKTPADMRNKATKK